jgi:hypothetical protein
VDAVGAQQQISLHFGAVGEVGDHLTAAADPVGVQPLAELEPDAAAFGLPTQRPLEQAAPEGDADGAVGEPDAVGHLTQTLAGAAPHHHGRHREARCLPGRVNPKGA